MSSEGVTTVTPQTPYSLVLKSDLEKCICVDTGVMAVLVQSFSIKNFTKKGDNFISIVTSVLAHYKSSGGQECEAVYVVKLNPLEIVEVFAAQVNAFFFKEIHFYKQMVPLLNSLLDSKCVGSLAVPKYLHSVPTQNEQVIYFEDLRQSGYQMVDCQKGFDVNHLKLVLKELAKLHASSYSLLSSVRCRNSDPVVEFPCLQHHSKLMAESGSVFNGTESTIIRLTLTIEVLKSMSGYYAAIDDLHCLIDEVKCSGLPKPGVPPLCEVISHGDCWSNNFLFK